LHKGLQPSQHAAFNDFSKGLASVYMTVTSGTQVYDRAKEAGHSDRTAGMITLGTLGGLYKLMQTEYGQWALKGIGLDEFALASKKPLREITEQWAAAYAGQELTTEAAKKTALKKL
jgi:hypothetical protein